MDTTDGIEMLVTRRSKRSTAGNRMEAALAEMALDEANKDMDDDNDFVNDKIEEDIFGSDFESTDEEAEKAIEQAGEAEAVYEERRTKKAARTRLERTTAAAHAKHRSSFNPDIQVNTAGKAKSASRVQRPPLQHNIADYGSSIIDERKRTSQRMHTVMNTSATVKRLKQSEARRASLPKKAKIETKRFTQAELIAQALDTEEGNIIEHRDYLKNEAEKRKRARVVRTAITGPLLRWTSRREEIKVPVTPPPPPPPVPVSLPQIPPPPPAMQAATSLYRSIYGPPGSLFTPTTYSYTGGSSIVSATASTSGSTSQTTAAPATPSLPTTSPFLSYQQYMDPTLSPFPTWPLPQQPYVTPTILTPTTVVQQPQTPTQATPTATEPSGTTQPPESTGDSEPPSPPEPEYRDETVTKNYLIHELGQQKGMPKASWAETMQAMFGDHVKWNEMKVFVGKGRPLSRPRQTCLITGRQAHYLDPRTGVPYADSYAYKVLTGLLRHEYVWNPSLGCYVDHGEPPDSVLARERNSEDSMTT